MTFGSDASAASKYGGSEIASSSPTTCPTAATSRERQDSEEGGNEPERTRKYSEEKSDGRIGYQGCTRAENAAKALPCHGSVGIGLMEGKNSIYLTTCW